MTGSAPGPTPRGPTALPSPPRGRGRNWPLFVVGFAAVAALLAMVDHLSGNEVVTLFKITAESEQVALTVAADHTEPIRLVGADVTDDRRHLPRVTGDLRLEDGVRVVLTRMAGDSVLALSAEAPNGGGIVGTLRPEDADPVQLQGGVQVVLPLAASDPARVRASLHFAARDVRIGARWLPATAGATQPLLRSGRVSLIGLAQGNAPFEAQSFELGPYEMVTPYPDGRPPTRQPLWWGTLTTTPGGAIETAFAVMDTRIALWRGSVHYRLGVTVFDHLRGHPHLALYCALFGVLAMLATTLLGNALESSIHRRATTRSWRP